MSYINNYVFSCPSPFLKAMEDQCILFCLISLKRESSGSIPIWLKILSPMFLFQWFHTSPALTYNMCIMVLIFWYKWFSYKIAVNIFVQESRSPWNHYFIHVKLQLFLNIEFTCTSTTLRRVSVLLKILRVSSFLFQFLLLLNCLPINWCV